MKVIIRNKLFSIGNGSTVKNETDEDVFMVKGRIFSPTRVKWVCDLGGNHLFKVRNKWFNFFARKAYVYEDDTKVAKVKKPFFSFKKFIVQGYGDEILIDGDFFSPKSTILRNGDVIGTITRNITFFKDAFTLEAEEDDMPFLIALVIAIDNIVDSMGS